MTNLDSVASLSLKTRTYNALVKGRFSGPISTISELVQLSEDDLYRRRGMGPGTVAEIKANLAERGFFLKG
jgi:DNA-directed RNA polymerase alpha subunit